MSGIDSDEHFRGHTAMLVGAFITLESSIDTQKCRVVIAVRGSDYVRALPLPASYAQLPHSYLVFSSTKSCPSIHHSPASFKVPPLRPSSSASWSWSLLPSVFG